MAVPVPSQLVTAIAGGKASGPAPLNGGNSGTVDFAALLASLGNAQSATTALPGLVAGTHGLEASLAPSITSAQPQTLDLQQDGTRSPLIDRLLRDSGNLQANAALSEAASQEDVKVALPPPGQTGLPLTGTGRSAESMLATAQPGQRRAGAGESDDEAEATQPTDVMPPPPSVIALQPPANTQRIASADAEQPAADDTISGLPTNATGAGKGGNAHAEMQRAITGNGSGNGNSAANLAGEAPAREETPAATANMAAPSASVAQAAAHAARHAETATANMARVDTPLHDTRWGQGFGERVVWLAKNEQQTAQISINPPQLGPLQVTLQLNGDQANAMFASPHAEVRQAIQDAMPQLREMLSAAGINLGQANVGSQTPQQHHEFMAQLANQNRSSGEAAILPGENHAAGLPSGQPIQRGRGLVDLFA